MDIKEIQLAFMREAAGLGDYNLMTKLEFNLTKYLNLYF